MITDTAPARAASRNCQIGEETVQPVPSSPDVVVVVKEVVVGFVVVVIVVVVDL